MTTITINVQNDSAATQSFLYFMSPVSSGNGAPSYCTSLGTATLGNYAQTGTIVTFMLDFEYQAGVQQAYSAPVAGRQSGFYSSSQSIALSTATGSTASATAMSLNPLSLSKPVPGPVIPAGMFRITTPVYDGSAVTYNAGTALRTTAGGVVLPSFVVASPNMNIDVRPVKTFYVAIGNAATGIVVVQSGFPATGLCDATTYTSFLVVYGASGTFSVTGYVDTSLSPVRATGAVPAGGPVSPGPKRIVVPL
ncbi:MAG TPA: hypothetical protein VHX12_12360 [Acidisoma sp.]|jgi:hypothetical protein|nr:hypothetical protein [Acidisoma sp.]